jgi:hypothetical protein
MTFAGIFSEGNLSSGLKEDRANRWILPVFGVLGVLQAWLPAYISVVAGAESVLSMSYAHCFAESHNDRLRFPSEGNSDDHLQAYS